MNRLISGAFSIFAFFALFFIGIGIWFTSDEFITDWGGEVMGVRIIASAVCLTAMCGIFSGWMEKIRTKQ